MRRAVLDLGSNSFHLLVADMDEDGHLDPVLREREMLHLGAAVEQEPDKRIPDDAAEQALDTVTYLTDLAHRSGAEELWSVATSALRDAANGHELVEQMEQTTGGPIRVLGGEDEAQLGYLGVRASVAIEKDPVLVLDLGGGSMELAIGRSTKVEWVTSLDLGVSRLATMLEEDPPTGKGIARIDTKVRDLLSAVVEEVGRREPTGAVAIGGTIRAIARVVAARNDLWLPATLNQIVLSRDDVDQTRKQLVALDRDGRLEVPGMKERRADRLHVAAVILDTVMEELSIREVTVSDWGLREGVLLDGIGVDTLPSGPDLREQAVDRFRRRLLPDDSHARHVARLALRLFDQTTDVHGLDDDARELLRHAAILHDIGQSIALRNNHKHGAYLVENAELRGFSPEEMAVITTLVRCYRSRGVKKKIEPYAALPSARRTQAKNLLALLQIADGLDRARDQSVHDLTVERRTDRIEIALHGQGLHVARTELARRTELFRRTFGIEVGIVDPVGG